MGDVLPLALPKVASPGLDKVVARVLDSDQGKIDSALSFCQRHVIIVVSRRSRTEVFEHL